MTSPENSGKQQKDNNGRKPRKPNAENNSLDNIQPSFSDPQEQATRASESLSEPSNPEATALLTDTEGLSRDAEAPTEIETESPTQATPYPPSESLDPPLWYVLRVQSGKEDRVKANLENRTKAMGLEDKILKVVVPSELVSEIRKGYKRVVERKIYPGYVMVQMLKNETTHYLVKSTPGVGDFAGVMSDNEVERMLLTCDHDKEKPKPKVCFRKGQSIKIKEGAFENYDGIVDEVNEQKGIVKVRIGIFGRYTQVELGYWQVEII